MIETLMNHPNPAIQRLTAIAAKSHRGAHNALDRRDMKMAKQWHQVRENAIDFVAEWGNLNRADVRAAVILLDRHAGDLPEEM
jgi:hypothetical protein